MEKSVIRKEIRTAMLDLDPEDRARDAAVVRDRCVALVREHGARSVMAYLADSGEVDLDPAIATLLADDRILEIGVPVISDAGGRMTCGRLRGLDAGSLTTDLHGLRSPLPPVREMQVRSLEMILVPGVAFTADGRRLGRGGGYYDRFLAMLPPTVHRVGICHSRQIRSDLPTEPHDVRVHELLIADES